MPGLQMAAWIAAGLVGLFLLLWIGNWCAKHRGRVGERMVAAQLRRFARKHGGKVCSNVYLPLYAGTCEIDHLLFGSFGVLVVETKHVGGEISGNGSQLRQVMGSKTHQLYNPQLQNKTHVDNVRHHLRKAGLERIPVQGLVVFSNSRAVLHTQAGIPLSRLQDTLCRLPNARQPWKQAYAALRAVQVRNPLRQLWHDWKPHRKKR